MPLNELAAINRLIDDVLDARTTSILEASLAGHRLFLAGCKRPLAIQTDLLRTLVAEASETEIGRALGFADIDSIERFREQVPIHTYEDLRPWIDRVIDGAEDVLARGRPTFFAQTSGTTGAPKRVPFSSAVPREYAAFLLPSFGAVEADIPGALAGRQMIFSRFIEGHVGGVPFGAANGYVRHLHDAVFATGRVPGAVYDEPVLNVRYYAMFLYLLSQPLVWLAALNPSTLLTFIDKLDAFGPRLAADLAVGGWAHGPEGVDAVMRTANCPLLPAPDTAKRIEHSLAASGRVELEQICPELRMITMWRGGNAKHYMGQVRARLPTCEIRSEVSGSSEAALLIPLDANTDGGVPSMFSTFFEFLPVEHEPGDGVLHGIEELRHEQGYRLIVTNRRGMYRLLMDDVFYLERYLERAPVLRFSHRHGLTSSLTGEKLTEWHVMEAVQAAVAGTRIPALDYQLRPEWGEPPRYALLVELDPVPDDLGPFLAALEDKLAEVNVEYAAKRSSQRLGPPNLVVLPRGELRRWQERELAATGRSDAQAKIARLRRDLLILDGDYQRVELR